MSDTTYGWDLMYQHCLNDISTKENVLTVLIHWYLTSKGFRCIGLGSEKEFDVEAVGSEALPNGWNKMGNDVALRYINNKRLFILRGVRSEEQMVFNFLRVHDYSVSSILLVVENSVHATRGTLQEMVPSYREILNKIRTVLIEPLHNGNKRDTSVQTSLPSANFSTSGPPRRDDNLWEPSQPSRVGIPLGGGARVGVEPNPWDPRGVGRTDLDPLAGIGHGGGGMVFDPFRGPPGGIRDPGLGIPGGLPRGAVPPGARFDPFGPPGPNRGGPGPRFGEPGPDHLPPPGYDDMFM